MADREASTVTRADEPSPVSPWRHRLVVLGINALVLAVIVLLVLPAVSMLQPGYYRRYPALGDRMDHWAASTHSRISCGECHVDPGAKALLTFSLKAIPAFYSQLVQGPLGTNMLKAPHREACQKCHTAYRSVSPSGDLQIPHRAHVEVLKMQCVQCHRNLVHSLNRRGFNRPEMEGCLEACHNGDKASNACLDCHTRKQAPASHARKDWLAVHGRMTEKIDCAECHDWTPEYCAECHAKRPASHVGNWKKGHAPEAKRRGKGCLVCHGGEKFCKKCH